MFKFLTSTIVVFIVLALAAGSLVLLHMQGRTTAVWIGAALLLLSLLLILLGGSPDDSPPNDYPDDNQY